MCHDLVYDVVSPLSFFFRLSIPIGNAAHEQDHPIVLTSDAFEQLTGYDRTQIIGRNCRFLQGPGTAPDAVQRVREALNRGEGCNELLLNYRKFCFETRYSTEILSF